MLLHETIRAAPPDSALFEAALNVNSASGSKAYDSTQGRPDVPRAATISLSATGVVGSVSWTFTVTGKSVTGKTITEVATISLAPGQASASSTLERGFAKVDSIAWTRSGTAPATASIAFGTSNVLQLMRALLNGVTNDILRCTFNKASRTVTNVYGLTGAVADGYPTFRFDGGVTSNVPTHVWYRAKLPEDDLQHAHVPTDAAWATPIGGRA